jgi:RNA polymerase sigma-70 factor (ECF subfamily)
MISDGVVPISSVLTGTPEGERPESSRQSTTAAQAVKRPTAQEPLITKTDELLMADVAKGSREALSTLFRRYRRSVLNVASRILKDASEAEDLCQEVFLRVFQRASSFDSTKGAASSWIVQIAYSRALNRKQYLTVRQHYTAQELNEEQLEGVRRPPFVDDVLAKSLLNQLREQLSEEQRSTLELHFFEGYSLREIAEKTGQNLGSVRHHYYRGLDRLRSNLFPQKGR